MKLPFNALPESVRKRFIACTHGASEPKPIYAATRSFNDSLRLGLILCGIGLGVLYFMAKASYGMSVDSTGWLLVYLPCAMCAMYGAFIVAKGLVASRRLPYDPGLYIFPMHFVKAEGPMLELTPMGDLVNFNGTHHSTNGVYTNTTMRFDFADGTTHSFSVRGQHKAEMLLRELSSCQQMLEQAAENQDIRVFAALDPFFEARVSDGWNLMQQERPDVQPSSGPAAGSMPKVLVHSTAMSLALGALLGFGTWQVRNMFSDDAMFEYAKQRATPWAVHDYEYSGGTRHLKELREVYLPKFEFEKAVGEGSVTALRDFRSRFPGSAHDQAAREAIHTLFQGALDKFREQANQNNPEVLPFMEALFAYLEKSDSPAIEVRFHPPGPSGLEEVDAMVASMPVSETDGVPISPMSPSFTDERSEPRESYIFTRLDEGFDAIVPNDMLNLQPGARIADAAAGFSVPTIAVAYTVTPSGTFYVNEDNSRGFVGIEIHFDVRMTIPESEAVLSFPVTVKPPQRFSVETYGDAAGIALPPSDSSVYDVMAKRAFENLSTQLNGAFFGLDEAATDEPPTLEEMLASIDAGIAALEAALPAKEKAAQKTLRALQKDRKVFDENMEKMARQMESEDAKSMERALRTANKLATGVDDMRTKIEKLDAFLGAAEMDGEARVEAQMKVSDALTSLGLMGAMFAALQGQ